MENPYKAFVNSSARTLMAFIDTLIAIIMIDSDSASTELLSPHQAVMNEGVDAKGAESLLFNSISKLNTNDKYWVISNIIETWHKSHTQKTEEFVCAFFQSHFPLTLNIDGLSYLSDGINKGTGKLLRSISLSESTTLLNSLLSNTNENINRTDSKSDEHDSVSIFALLSYWQKQNSTTTNTEYLKILVEKPIELSGANKNALYFLFLNTCFARLLSNAGYSLYDTTDNLYSRIRGSSQIYVVKILREAFDDSSASTVNDLRNELIASKANENSTNLFLAPFFDIKLVTLSLQHFVNEDSKRYKDNKVNTRTKMLLDFLESYLGKEWLWDSRESDIFKKLRWLQAKGLSFAHNHIINNVDIATLASGIRREDDVKIITKSRDILPYDLLSKTNNKKALTIIAKLISA